jgi:hypothetical protein
MEARAYKVVRVDLRETHVLVDESYGKIVKKVTHEPVGYVPSTKDTIVRIMDDSLVR